MRWLKIDDDAEFVTLLEENGRAVSPRRQRRLRTLSKVVDAATTRATGRTFSNHSKLCTGILLGSIAMALSLMKICSSSLATANTLDKPDVDSNLDSDEAMKVAFSIAKRRFQSRLSMIEAKSNDSMANTTFLLKNGFANLQEHPIKPTQPLHPSSLLNSIRIPKAGSSALSVTSRALAGCHPDGFPCCTYPGNPVGSCPREGLECPQVTGCGGHHPNLSGNEPIITTVREPTSRLLSGFFSSPIHRPSMDKGHSWQTFENDYIKNATFRNVMTKMFSGDYAYNVFEPNVHTVAKAKQTICKMEWFGIAELPILSSLLLYESPAFALLTPNPVTFGLPPTKQEAEKSFDDDGRQTNDSEDYLQFKARTFPDHNGTALVQNYNGTDFHLYKFITKLFCPRLDNVEGVVEDIQRANIAEEELQLCRQVLLRDKETIADLCPESSAGSN
jgi:hypothetical protein